MKKKHSTILWLALLFCSLIAAQEYTDAQLNFDEQIIRQELQAHHNKIPKAELDQKVQKIRDTYIEMYEYQTNVLLKNQSRMAIPILNTGCTNMDFSQNTLGWTYHWSNTDYGDRPSVDENDAVMSRSAYGDASPTIIDPMDNQVRFRVLSANTPDPRLGENINPGAQIGDQVLLLGDSNELPNLPINPGFPGNAGQEEVSKSFTVTNENAVLQYGYAIVFEDPGHTDIPNSFDVFIDVNGVPLTGCSVINFTFVNANTNGFIPSAIDPADRVRRWQTNTIDLLANPNIQLNDVVTISFKNSDCGYALHSSYAYVSAKCLPKDQSILATSSSGDFCTDELITFTAEIDVPSGATTQLQILSSTGNVINSANNTTTLSNTFTQPGIYTINFTVNDPSGCNLNSSIDIEVKDCCTELGNEILDSLEETKTCGEYQLTIPQSALDIYEIIFFSGQGQPITLDATMIENDTFTFNYDDNGTFAYSIRLTNLETGEQCFRKRKKITVFCCDDCNTAGAEIFNSLSETETCGEYTITIPNRTLDCYKLEAIIGFNTITFTEDLITNGQYTFNFDNNGDYPFAISLYNIKTGKKCFYNKRGIEVRCFPCDWPKTIGTNNPLDPEGYLAEYVNAAAEDSNGNIVTLGRARVGANIEGQILSSECFIAKYDYCGDLLSLTNVPLLKYPIQMELQDDNSMITLSSETAPFSNQNLEFDNYYLDKFDSNGNHMWRVTMNAYIAQPLRDLSFTLNHLNNETFVKLPRHHYGQNGAFVTDAVGTNYKPIYSVIMKFDANGVLTWQEELSNENPTLLNQHPVLFDVDYDETNQKLRVYFGAQQNSIVHLSTSNVDIQIEDVSYPEPTFRNAVLQYSANATSGTVSFDSSFHTIANNGTLDERWIVSNGTYTYISVTNGNVFAYDDSGNLVGQIHLNHRIGDLKHFSGRPNIYSTGHRLNNNSGFGLSNIENLGLEWDKTIYMTLPNFALTMDILRTSDDRTFVTGVFKDFDPVFEDNIGGTDGFIIRFRDDNGTIVSGFNGSNSNQKILKSGVAETHDLRSYPNPFSSQFAVDSKSGKTIKQVEIYNAYGMLMQSKLYTNGETIYFSKGASGLYFAKIHMNNGDVHIINLIKK